MQESTKILRKLVDWSGSKVDITLGKSYLIDGVYFKDDAGEDRHIDSGVWEKGEGKVQAMRFNAGKPELSYILSAPYAIEGLAEVFAFGAVKYARDNWKKGLPQEQVCDSLLRHLTSYMNGEDLDPESGMHHLNHVLWNALIMADQGNGKRPE